MKILCMKLKEFKDQIIYILLNPLLIMIFVGVFTYFMYKNVKSKQVNFKIILSVIIKSFIICILYWAMKKLPITIYDVLIKCSQIYEGLELFVFNIIIGLELLFLLIFITIVYERKWGEKINNKLIIGFSRKVWLSHLVFVSLAFLIMFFVFALVYSIDSIDDDLNLVSGFSIINNGLLCNVIILMSGSFTKKVYSIIFNFTKKNSLRILGYNSRMWAFIVVCIFYAVISSDEEIGEMSYIASSIVWGKLFWIDDKKEGIKHLLSSFWDLPLLVILLYCMIINFSIIFRILKNIDSSGYFSDNLITYGASIALIIYIIFMIVRYINLIIEWMNKEINANN